MGLTVFRIRKLIRLLSIKILPMALCAVATNHTYASVIHQCLGEHGEPVFSNIHCGKVIERVELGEAMFIDGEAMRDTARRQLKVLQSMSPNERRANNSSATSAKSTRKGLGFAERAELRRLEIEADGLRRDLNRAINQRKRASLKANLKAASRRISALQKKQTPR